MKGDRFDILLCDAGRLSSGREGLFALYGLFVGGSETIDFGWFLFVVGLLVLLFVAVVVGIFVLSVTAGLEWVVCLEGSA